MELTRSPLVRSLRGSFGQWVINPGNRKEMMISHKPRYPGPEMSNTKIVYGQKLYTELDKLWWKLTPAQRVAWRLCTRRTNGHRISGFAEFKAFNMVRWWHDCSALRWPPSRFGAVWADLRPGGGTTGKLTSVIVGGKDKNGQPIPPPGQPGTDPPPAGNPCKPPPPVGYENCPLEFTGPDWPADVHIHVAQWTACQCDPPEEWPYCIMLATVAKFHRHPHYYTWTGNLSPPPPPVIYCVQVGDHFDNIECCPFYELDPCLYVTLMGEGVTAYYKSPHPIPPLSQPQTWTRIPAHGESACGKWPPATILVHPGIGP